MASLDIRIISSDEWHLLREMRLRALEESPELIGGEIETERAWSESQWRAQLEKFNYLIASAKDLHIGGMQIERLDGDFGATCWIGSCWIDPSYRGQGALRSLFDFVDAHSQSMGWSVQGLGVWVDNHKAIAAYEKLGFRAMGPQKPVDMKDGTQRFYQRMIRDRKNN